MGLGGVLGDRQPASDLAVVLPTGKAGEHLGLAWRQECECGCRTSAVGGAARSLSRAPYDEASEVRAKGARVRYDVSLTLHRTSEQSGLGRVAAAVVGGVLGAVGVSRSTDSDVTLSFQREAQASRALADHLTLDLGESPPGEYRKIGVSTRRIGLNLRTRRGYVVTHEAGAAELPK